MRRWWRAYGGAVFMGCWAAFAFTVAAIHHSALMACLGVYFATTALLRPKW